MPRFAACCSQLSLQPMPILMSMSALVFCAILLIPDSAQIATLCGQISIQNLLDLNLWNALVWSPFGLLVDWCLMIIAMMLPLLSQQIWHVWASSQRKRRLDAILLFLLAYVFCWLLAGLVLVPLAIATAALAPDSLDILIAIVIALVWSASPWAQAARNRCHRLERIGVNGFSACIDSARQGLVSVSACVSTCWAWMMIPLMAEPPWHESAMLVVAIVLLLDRMASPISPGWRRPPAWTILFGSDAAQTRFASSSTPVLE